MSGLQPIASWTHTCATRTQVSQAPALNEPKPYIARGGGCSFGDAAFLSNDLTVTNIAKPSISINADTLSCRVSANFEMGELHRTLLMNGYQFPVYGGTQWATVGGATASDIHGKNHHRVGSFGRHVNAIELQLASGEVVICSPYVNAELFAATIGGMGLTGMILNVELKIRPVEFTSVVEQKVLFSSFDEMLALLKQNPDFHYACLYVVDEPINGWYLSANYSDEQCDIPKQPKDWTWLPHLPIVRDSTLKLANHIARKNTHNKQKIKHVFGYNYGGPHQMVKQANRFLPRSGVIEFHYHLSDEYFAHSLELLVAMSRSANVQLTHLVVKRMGDFESPGMLSFTASGWAINFQLQDSSESRAFLSVFAHELSPMNPRYYLAKDSSINAEQYLASEPNLARWQALVKSVDPTHLLRSDLSQRLNLKPW
ncbi:FAD-binding oxidoreductase [Vibrio penaeicida]|uniref:FAD-binding oxidoreductase n=1 Tax=Vibrio penaeicida TaxID=104609 RepID=UPI00142E418C|nr:FAD-binding oxidoreductase [Vibrio penaeicida]